MSEKSQISRGEEFVFKEYHFINRCKKVLDFSSMPFTTSF